MKTPSIIHRATDALNRYRLRLIRQRDAERVAGLPDYLLKDIGWPASYGENCVDCSR